MIDRMHLLRGRSPLKALAFLANFGLAKVTIYLAPLLIAAVASPELYGGTEVALSIGLMIGSLLFGGPMSGLTQMYLVQGRRGIQPQVAAITALSAASALIATAVAWLLAVPAVPLMIVAALGTAGLHNIGSALFRLLGRRNATAWADGSSTIIAAIVVGIALLSPVSNTIGAATIGYAIVSTVALIAALTVLRRHQLKTLRADLTAALLVGLPMVIVGTMAMWIGTGGRVVIGLVAASDVPAYGVAFRVAGLVLGIQQLVVTASFAWLYRARTRAVDPVLAWTLVGVALVSMAITFVAPLVIAHVGFAALDARGERLVDMLLPVLGLHVFFWIAFAMLQARINRAGLAGRSILPIAIVTAVGVAVLFAAATVFEASTYILSWLIAGHALVYVAALWILLARARLPHVKVGIAILVGGGALFMLAAYLGMTT